MLKKIGYVTVFCVLLLALHVGQVKAFDYPPIPLLKLMPEEIACHKYGESFSVAVWLMGEDHLGLDSLWDIAGFDLNIYFDPSLVNAVNVIIDPDGWYSSFWPNGVFEVRNQVDNSIGTVEAIFLGIPESGIHQPPRGIGRVLSIDFLVVAANVTSQTGAEITIEDYLPYALAGFPHPERYYPPWGAPPPQIPPMEVIIPYVVENSTFYFSPSGDVNFDGKVNIQDLVIMSSMYGCRKGEPNWHVSADLAPPYGKIDILDLVTCIGHYGEKYP